MAHAEQAGHPRPLDRSTQSTPVHNLLAHPATVHVPDRGAVTVRPATLDDLDEVAAMHARCSSASTYGRYLAGTPRRAMLAEVLRTAVALVGVAPGGSVVALANVAASESPGTAELAVLVEDDWQGHGLGTALVRHLVAAARLLGFDAVEAVTLPSATWPDRALRLLGSTTTEKLPFGEVTSRLTLAPHHLGGLASPREPVERVVLRRS